MQLDDEVRRDILMLRGLNYTYDEIAAWLADNYDDAPGASAVGRIVRDMEDQARAAGPRPVYDRVVSRGYLQDLLAG